MASPTKIGGARFVVLALLAGGTMINYLDRTVLGVAAPNLTKDLGLSPAVMGVVFSAFSWTYAASQIPGGLFLDRFGAKLTYALSVGLWSLTTLCQSLVGGMGSLLALRLSLGVAESPCFPANSRVVSTWFPQAERGAATGVYTVGEYVGLAFFSPLMFWAMGAFGWRWLFVAVGVLGLAFALVWWAIYQEPHDSRASQAELNYIAAGGGLEPPAQSLAFSWRSVGWLLSQRQMLGACFGQFAGNSTLVFFLTWFPTYLATERHMGWLKLGIYAVLPFIAASIGVMSGGFISDLLLKATGSANIGRKLPVVVGLLLASTIISANWISSDAAVIAVMSIAFFGQGLVGLGWSLISDIAPKSLAGLTGGVFNLAANLAGITTPLVIGLIVSRTGSFVWALAFVGVVALLGAASYLFILGDVKRLEPAAEKGASVDELVRT